MNTVDCTLKIYKTTKCIIALVADENERVRKMLKKKKRRNENQTAERYALGVINFNWHTL
jgi:hypothetical protein